MFKKSNSPGDRTPKQEPKVTAAKEAAPANAPAPEKTDAPAVETKKS